MLVRSIAVATLTAATLLGSSGTASAQLYGDESLQRPFWREGRRGAFEMRPDTRYNSGYRRSYRSRYSDDADYEDGPRWQRNRYRDRYADPYDDEWNDRGLRSRRQLYADEAPKNDEVRNGGPQPQIVAKAPPRVQFVSDFKPGSVVIDQSARKLYLILSNREAYRYPISVGREGFSWTGTEKVSRIADWPDWYPPVEMRERDPRLPVKMTGGLRNPLGAKAIYLGKTLYRIHGTNDPKSIGRAASSGCFRMMNANVLHLAQQVQIGAEVHVLKHLPKNVAAANGGAG